MECRKTCFSPVAVTRQDIILQGKASSTYLHAVVRTASPASSFARGQLLKLPANGTARSQSSSPVRGPACSSADRRMGSPAHNRPFCPAPVNPAARPSRCPARSPAVGAHALSQAVRDQVARSLEQLNLVSKQSNRQSASPVLVRAQSPANRPRPTGNPAAGPRVRAPTGTDMQIANQPQPDVPRRDAAATRRARSPAAVARRIVKPMVGHFLLWESNTPYKPSLYITTAGAKGQGRYRHHVKGISGHSESELDEWEWELAEVDGKDVRGWTHCVVTHWIKDLVSLRRKDTVLTMEHCREPGVYLEVTLVALDEDGLIDRGVGERVREAFEIFVRTIQSFAVTPDIQEVQFQSKQLIRVRHGAQYGHFLRAQGNTVCMDNCDNRPDDEFTCYKFYGQDRDETDGQGAFMCVLQKPNSNVYLVPVPSTGKLTTVQGTELDIQIHEITEADPRFFCMVRAGQGQNSYFLRPLIFTNYYLMFDSVNGLSLKRCNEPPYKPGSRETVRNFTFEFIPAP